MNGNGRLSWRVLWGDLSPFALLPGGALLFVASDRLAHSLLVLAAFVWVYCLSSLAVFAGSRFFPTRGRTVLLAFVASFAACLYLLLISTLFPLAALHTFFAVSLVPMLRVGSGTPRGIERAGLARTLRLSFADALVAGSLVVALALIREPLGFRSLSLPGGASGLLVFHPFGDETPVYLRFLSGSFGALALLGYGLGAYRHLREKQTGGNG